MSEKMFNTRIIHKHDIAENWAKATGFIPKIGELIIYDPDENYAYSRIKIGDGTKTVGELSFIDEINISNYATYNYVDNKFANLVNSAPEALDTLGELAAAMEENDGVVNALNQAIANKADNSTVTQLQEAVNAKAENSALNEHTTNSTIHITAVERAAWNSKMDGDSELISIADIDAICGSVTPIAEVLF